MKYLMIFTLLFSINACSNLGFRASGLGTNSFVVSSVSEEMASFVANDLVETLSQTYAPGHTKIYLNFTGGQGDKFGIALENAMRNRGFSVTNLPDASALSISYIFDKIGGDEESFYARIAIENGIILAKTYSKIGETLSAAGTTKKE
ncbi:MAG: hypothetical protein ACRCTY_08760 [Candidatus Adiutrix sp.]